jgi:hypothetical protein
MTTLHHLGDHSMSTLFEHPRAVVEKAAKQTVTTLVWFVIQIVGCVVTAMALASAATLVSRHFFAGM